MVRTKFLSSFPCFGGNQKPVRPISGITSKSKYTVQYPDLLSAVRSVPHSEEFSISKPPSNQTVTDDYSDSEDH